MAKHNQDHQHAFDVGATFATALGESFKALSEHMPTTALETWLWLGEVMLDSVDSDHRPSFEHVVRGAQSAHQELLEALKVMEVIDRG